MTATRARKTTQKAPEPAPATEENSVAAETEQTTLTAEESPAVSTPKAPEAAPLEPPIVDEAPEPPAEPSFSAPNEVIPDEANLSDVILDDATKEPPTDLDAVFQPQTPYGSSLRCTVRLIERTHIGPHRSPIHRLLQPAGGVVSEGVANRILERLRAQAAAADAEQ